MDHACKKPDGSFYLNCWAVIGNFDNDTNKDIMVGGEFYLNTASGNYEPGIHTYHGTGLLTNKTSSFVCNVDWDNPDIPSEKTGLPSASVISPPPDKYHNDVDSALGKGLITFGDVDNDGDDDAVVCEVDGNGGNLVYYERTQLFPPKWEKDPLAFPKIYSIDWVCGKPALLDYDGDGDLDIITSNSHGYRCITCDDDAKFNKFMLLEQGLCAASCTSTGDCSTLFSDFQPSCQCSFTGATAGRACNSCDGGYFFRHSDSAQIPTILDILQNANDQMPMDTIAGTDAGVCRPCGAGRFGRFSETRRPEKDNFNQFDGTCTNCPRGYFQDNEAASACGACPQGWHQKEGEFKFCFSCLAGQYTNKSGSTECKSCPQGWMQSRSSQTSCNKAAADQIVLNGGAVAVGKQILFVVVRCCSLLFVLVC